ncbi:unnamed protein product, partial [marine sediment metagenome]
KSLNLLYVVDTVDNVIIGKEDVVFINIANIEILTG